MILFYLLLLVIAALPVAMLLPPLLGKTRRKPENTELVDQEAADQMNIEIARNRIDEVQQHLETSCERTLAERELQATLFDDLQNRNSPQGRTTTVPAAWNMALLLVIPVASLIIYSRVGNPQFIDTRSPLMAGNPNPVVHPDLDTLLVQLEEKIAGDPENPKGWELAASTYMRIGNYAKAENAYAELNRLVVGNPDLLAAWADASIMNNGGYTPVARKQVEKALSIDPFHVNALWLAGLGSLNLGNQAEAADYLNRLKPLLGDNQESLDRVNDLLKRSAAGNVREEQASATTGEGASGRNIKEIAE